MILKNLMNIISAYNENGIYFLFRGVLWWFNGKRIEKWCYCPDITRIFAHNGKLYGIYNNLNKFILKNQQFKYYCGSQQKIFGIETYGNPFRICFDDDNNLFEYSLGGFRKNGTCLTNKSRVHGFKLLHYDGFLYYFNRYNNGINEKFDIQKNQWSSFNHQTINEIDDVYLLNDLFYILFKDGKIGTYNSKTDTWQLLSNFIQN